MIRKQSMTATTLSTIPKLISQVLAIYEIAPEEIFHQAGVELNSTPTVENRVSMENMGKLWELSVSETKNEQLGLVAASLFQPAYLKGIGLAWMASANLEEGLRRFVSNSHLVNTAMKIELIEKDDQLIIQYQPKSPLNDQAVKMTKAHPCALQLGIGFFLKMFRMAASKNIPATGVYFTFPIVESKGAYEEYFQCPVYGDCESNAISFSKSLLNELLPTHDPELVKLNESAISKYLNAMHNGDTSTKVIKIITELLPIGCPSEEVIAHKLFMSKRTLQRKLNKEGKLYSSLLNTVRFTLAKQHLTMTNMAITEVAYQLGYSSPSTFARAFKNKLDISPAEYRNKNM
jgi:AraC-like DNA-binding protein